MGKSKRPSRNDQRVESLFQDLRALAGTPGGVIAAELEGLARRRRPGWKADLAGSLRTLEATAAINADQRAYLERAAGQCAERTGLHWPAVFVACWTFVILATANRSWLLAPSMAATITLYASAAIAAFFAIWLSRRPVHFSRALDRDQRLQLGALASVAALMAVIFADRMPVTARFLTQTLSQLEFRADRQRVLAEEGAFPMLRSFAKQYYGVSVYLGDAGDGWASTSTVTLGSSPASMLTMAGYCHLNLNRMTLRSSFEGGEPRLEKQFVQGVLMHEFAHCLDIRRDLAAVPAVHTFSIAPPLATAVADLDGFIVAADAPETKQWREALADIFAVGYWRWSAGRDADALVERLAKKRTEAAADDPDHATTCWISAAQKAPAPAGPADLLTWSDTLRSTAPCALKQKA